MAKKTKQSPAQPAGRPGWQIVADTLKEIQNNLARPTLTEQAVLNLVALRDYELPVLIEFVKYLGRAERAGKTPDGAIAEMVFMAIHSKNLPDVTNADIQSPVTTAGFRALIESGKKKGKWRWITRKRKTAGALTPAVASR